MKDEMQAIAKEEVNKNKSKVNWRMDSGCEWKMIYDERDNYASEKNNCYLRHVSSV